ncbi:Putative fluoride ion transporter CrcB [Streptomyces sp. enrichment culture]|uniref:fluoride efflux transporter CrcB n=1 Tax=Streptomyces sp. enrichment culture TaxID=1795815 RepID=UPI003F55738A
MTAPGAQGPGVRPAAPRRPARRTRAPVVAAVALGGGTGAAARYAASLWWPAHTAGFPWTTFWVNVSGCAAIGVLMAVLAGLRTVHPLVRPFLGTGVLGGFTTFSTYAVDVRQLAVAGHLRTALAYLAATPLAALAAVWLASWAARRVLGRGQP